MTAMGSEMTKFSKERRRRVQRGPMAVKRKRTNGEKMRPPIPAPESMKPIADPRCVVKYSGAEPSIGKYINEQPIP